MEYLTAEDVYGSVKQLDKDDAQTATITSFIKQEEAIVNGLLAYKYQLPIEKTDETIEARELIKGIVLYKVLARLEIFLNLQGEEGQAIVDKKAYWEMHKFSIMQLEKNTIKLKGVPVIQNFVVSNFPKARFNRDVDNW